MPVTFLAPWYLLACLAIAVPIVIHLLQRRREVILPYSMVRFVLMAKRRSSRRLKLRRLLLLLARVAAVLLLALLLARPVLTSPASSLYGKEAGRTVVIVDNSLSMTAGAGKHTRFGLLRSLVGDFVRAAPAEESFILVPAAATGKTIAPGVWRERNVFLEEVDGAKVLPRRGDFVQAFAKAYQLLREGQGKEGRIAVFTDLARGSWSDFSISSLEEMDTSVPVVLFQLGSQLDSRGAGVVALEVEGREMVEGGAIRLAGKVVNHGPERALTVALHIDGRVADRKVVDIAPGGEGVVSFVLRDLEAGNHRVELVLKKDWYQADDRRLAGLRLGAPVSVLLVDGDPRFSLVESETFFLREALRSDRLSSEQPVVTRVVEAGSLAETDLEKFDVVILANVPAPSDGTALVDFVTGGGGLVIFWGANCRAGEYESSLSSILPVRPAEAATAVSGSPFRIGEVNTADRMLGIFRPPGGGSFTTASFYRRAGIAAEMQRGTVTARFSDGSPWMVRGRTGGGEVVFFSSTADLEWNDLPTKPVFVPLLRRVVMEISGEFQDEREAGVEAGEAKVFSGESELAYSTITVVRPDGEIRRQEFVPRQGKVSARFEETDMVGFYSYTGEGREGVFAVNPPAAESDLQPLGAEELESRFQQIPLELRSSGGGEGEEGLFQRGSRSLTRPLLAGLFLLLLVEMVIAGPRRTGGRLPR